ncbi:MAG: TlpA family protein disulfide reductase [Myxococcales bacterium]|nr:TlpA family protein disulfide reductase [Myxococcales bacterium]
MRPPLLTPADRAEAAPEWTVERWFGADGAPALADYRGRVLVIHAFQMLCPGCVQHGVPQAQRIARTFSPEQVAVVGLHTVFEHHEAMRPVSLEAFLHEYRVQFPVGVDAPRDGQRIPTTMATYGMRGTPTLLIVDAAGRLRVHAFGQAEDLAVGAAIATVVAEGASAGVAS